MMAIMMGTKTEAKLHMDAMNPKAAPNWLSGTTKVMVAQMTMANKEYPKPSRIMVKMG